LAFVRGLERKAATASGHMEICIEVSVEIGLTTRINTLGGTVDVEGEYKGVVVVMHLNN